jgi:hypothetical protein
MPKEKEPTLTSDNEQDTDTDRPIREILDELDND